MEGLTWDSKGHPVRIMSVNADKLGNVGKKSINSKYKFQKDEDLLTQKADYFLKAQKKAAKRRQEALVAALPNLNSTQSVSTIGPSRASLHESGENVNLVNTRKATLSAHGIKTLTDFSKIRNNRQSALTFQPFPSSTSHIDPTYGVAYGQGREAEKAMSSQRESFGSKGEVQVDSRKKFHRTQSMVGGESFMEALERAKSKMMHSVRT